MSSKRSVLLVSRSLPLHGAGGMEFVAWDLARALRRNGLTVHVLTTRIPGQRALIDAEGVTVHTVPDADPGRYSKAWWRGSAEWFRQRGSDVGAVLSVSAGAYRMLRDRRVHPSVRFVMQAHGTALSEVRSKLRTRSPYRSLGAVRNAMWLGRDLHAYPRFDRIVAVGPMVARQLGHPLLTRAVPGGAPVVIDNGVDTERFRPDAAARSELRESLGWEPDDRVVATVCRLHGQKGVVEALRGVAAFRSSQSDDQPSVRWLVAGDGPASSSVREAAARMLPAESVRFLGEVGRDEVPALLNAADVFLFPTLRDEGLPLNALEAAAVGLPLVLSRALRAGLDLPGPVAYVQPSDPVETGAALERLVSARRTGGDRMAPSFPERYTMDYCAARYGEVLFPESTR